MSLGTEFRAFFRTPAYLPLIGRCLSADQIRYVLSLGRIHPRLAFVLNGPCCLSLRVVTPVGKGRLQDDETRAVYVRLFGDVRGPRVYDPSTKNLIGRPRIWAEEGLPREVQESFFECFRPYVPGYDRVEGVVYLDYRARKPSWSRHIEVRVQVSIPSGVWPPKTAAEVEALWGQIEGLAVKFVELMYGADLSAVLKKTRHGMELLETGEDYDDPSGQIYDDHGAGYTYCGVYRNGEWEQVPCGDEEG